VMVATEMPWFRGGTGSRSLQTAPVARKLEAVELVKVQLGQDIETHGDNLRGCTGMSEGFDKLLALQYIDLNVPFEAAVPSKDYGDYYWRDHSLTGKNMLAQFKDILDAAVKVTYIKEDILGITEPGVYINEKEMTASWKRSHGRHINFIRNDYMVELCDHFMVWDPSSPGTKDCLASIKAAGKPYTVLYGEDK